MGSNERAFRVIVGVCKIGFRANAVETAEEIQYEKEFQYWGTIYQLRK